MPRKAFVADLQEAIELFKKSNVADLRAGEEDGMINFRYDPYNSRATEVTILVPELGDYPTSHIYMFYTNSENVPPSVHSALSDMSDCQGLKVLEMLSKMVKRLDKVTAGSRHNPVDLEDADPLVIDSEPELEQYDEPEDFDSDEDSWSPKASLHSAGAAPQVSNNSKNSRFRVANTRIRHDLRLAKAAGFRVGYLGQLLDNGVDGFVTISCRVTKLGISEEALQAWHMESTQYFILLIRYTSGYKSLDLLLGQGSSREGNGLQMRVGVCKGYKISIDDAIAAFSTLEDRSKSRKLLTAQQEEDGGKVTGLGRLFIGRPMDEVLNDRLVPLLRYRMAMGFLWDGAEAFLNDHQGRNFGERDGIDPKYYAEDRIHLSETLPKIVTQDHLTDTEKDHSFPLIAMQFSLRHLVRCTEFCLVCHCKVEADFEALKPYVCSKPLCLYQYMSLGFGPSIEHEIITQPHVVDLLVSFCYTSATYNKLRHLPTGMALMVPSPWCIEGSQAGYPPDLVLQTPFPMKGAMVSVSQQEHAKAADQRSDTQMYKAKFDRQKMELIFPPGPGGMLKPGYWIIFKVNSNREERWHCRVIEVLFPTVRLGTPIIQNASKMTTIIDRSTAITASQQYQPLTGHAQILPTLTPAPTPPPISTDAPSIPLQEIAFLVYDQNFDELGNVEKQRSICQLLDTLPSVQRMRDFLQSKGGQDTSLRHWVDRISPAALGILRWIIASNRSCLIQVDDLEGTGRRSEERVSGMSDWMQFRFAQGAPDKEQRFITSIRNITPDAKHPTMFAWHGSPLHNWHGIVREGLHFERTDHGRAYGHGVYHALQVSTSLGYSGMPFYRGVPKAGTFGEEGSRNPGQWPNSQLKISSAIALNEIVNAPLQFVSKSPHLVVAQLDWIQSRYLFVKCNNPKIKISESIPTQVYEQDPTYYPIGESSKPIKIPITAVSKSRRPSSKATKTGNKKIKVANGKDEEEMALNSDATDAEDLFILRSDSEDEPVIISVQANKGTDKPLPALPPKAILDASKTDFIPGTVDHKSLPLLKPPSFATSMATKTLQRELANTLKVQDTHPAHELGWYIDPELINNVYQWIVELHSFEPHLPLAKDMKTRGLKSVVLEIRFGKDYPMSPPFVRVIRPRFLSFMAGGGGHVTAGGALCMELLTNSGWSAVSNIESVLLQVRLAMSSTDPRPAKLEPGPVRDYQTGEAIEAFIRAVSAHGWEIPPDFRQSYSASGPQLPDFGAD